MVIHLTHLLWLILIIIDVYDGNNMYFLESYCIFSPKLHYGHSLVGMTELDGKVVDIIVKCSR